MAWVKWARPKKGRVGNMRVSNYTAKYHILSIAPAVFIDSHAAFPFVF